MPLSGPLTVAEACAVLRVNKRTLYRYIKDGRLPADRVGPSLLRLNAADVEKLKQPAVELDAEGRVDSLAEHIRRVVDAAPPLTAAQRDRLALMLAPTGADGS